MEAVEQFFIEIGPVKAALLATIFTWFLTALGASVVFFFKNMNRGALDTMLGFTGSLHSIWWPSSKLLFKNVRLKPFVAAS